MKSRKFSFTPSEKRHYRRLLITALRNHQEILFAYLFGSFSEDLPFSDLDVGIYLSPGALPPEKARQYEIEMGIALDLKVGLPVDLIVLNYAPLALRYHIASGQLLFSRDEPARFAFLEATWRDYFDYYPMVRQFSRDLFEPLPRS